jgi:hypothetical protein
MTEESNSNAKRTRPDMIAHMQIELLGAGARARRGNYLRNVAMSSRRLRKTRLGVWQRTVCLRKKAETMLRQLQGVAVCGVLAFWVACITDGRREQQIQAPREDSEALIVEAKRIARSYIEQSPRFNAQRFSLQGKPRLTIWGIPYDNFEIDAEKCKQPGVVTLVYWDKSYYQNKVPPQRLPPRPLGGFPHFFIITVDVLSGSVVDVYAERQ